MRIRISFSKNEMMRYTSHLDVQRAWERMFRRAQLPLAYTQGYSPHPRLNLASALPLGFTSEAEILDAWLEKQKPINEILSSLLVTLPPGIEIRSIDEVDEKLPPLQTGVIASEYMIFIFEEIPDLENLIDRLLQAESVKRIRHEKEYDLRLLILSIQNQTRDGMGHQRLILQLKAMEGATGRPEEVLSSLGIKPDITKIHRTRLILN